MLRLLFEKYGMRQHIRSLLVQIKMELDDLFCTIHKANIISQFLIDYSTEYRHMVFYQQDFTTRKAIMLNNYNHIHNMMKKIDIEKKGKPFLINLIDELNYVLSLIKKEYHDIYEIYKINISNNYNYVRSADPLDKNVNRVGKTILKTNPRPDSRRTTRKMAIYG